MTRIRETKRAFGDEHPFVSVVLDDSMWRDYWSNWSPAEKFLDHRTNIGRCGRSAKVGSRDAVVGGPPRPHKFRICASLVSGYASVASTKRPSQTKWHLNLGCYGTG